MLVQLDPSVITNNLIDTYVTFNLGAAEHPSVLGTSSCAGNIVAIAKKLGAGQWSRLRDLFICLTRSQSDYILASLAGTIHELAHLLPSDAFRHDVLPFLLKMMQEGSLSVRSGIAQNFFSLISGLEDNLQEPCLHRVAHLPLCKTMHQTSGKHCCVTICTKGWRLRASLARQLFQLASLLRCDLVCKYLLPHAFQLCEDSVAYVRTEATHQLAEIFAAAPPKQTAIILEQLETWQRSPNFKLRCVAARLCSEAKQKPLMLETMSRIHQLLSRFQLDAVVDVRRLV